MMRTLSLVLLAAVCAAEVVEYRGIEPIILPVPLTTSPSGLDAIRSVVLLGVTKATVKGTWSTDQLNVIQNGNVLRVALLQNPPSGHVPVTVVGDNGVLYHIEVHAAAPNVQLDPIVNVIAMPGAGNAGAVAMDDQGGAARSALDRQQVNGGAFEHSTNLAIKLHKHIRGGRQLPEVRTVPLYNEELLVKERRRVPGRVRTISDDYKVLGYYEWTLGNITATYIGVTYTGRFPERDLAYLEQQADRMRFVWRQPRPEDGQVFDRKFPVVRMKQGVEEFFLVYEER